MKDKIEKAKDCTLVEIFKSFPYYFWFQNKQTSQQNKRRQLRDQLTVIELSAKTQTFEAELQQLVWQGESRDELNRQYNV